MTHKECSTTEYRDGCCWKCTCRRTTAPRVRSFLKQSHVTYGEFVKILAYLSKTAAEQANLAENTVWRFFNKIHERIAEDVTSKTKINGRVGTVLDWTNPSSANINITAAGLWWERGFFDGIQRGTNATGASWPRTWILFEYEYNDQWRNNRPRRPR